MPDDPLGRAETIELIRRHDIRPAKALGQHFLVEPNIVRRIVEISGVGPGDRVLEVGAGAGTLTRALARTGAEVVAYEVDDRLRPLLAETVGGLDVELRFADATRADLGDRLADGQWVLVANLPYNVGTSLVLELLQHAPSMHRFVVMLQREAVDRLAASPGTKVYGLPSVVAALHGEVHVALRVPPHVFVPTPKVESAVAVIERSAPAVEAATAVAIASAAFRQRRKMIRSSLRGIVGTEAIEEAGLDPRARAEQLSPEDYVALARTVS